MLNTKGNLVTFCLTVLAVTLLYGCGSSDPDLNLAETFDDSPLQFGISSSGSKLKLDWDAVDGATQYRLTQTAGDADIITDPGRERLVEELSVTFDISTLSFDPGTTEFQLEALVGAAWQLIGIQNALGSVVTSTELQFSWDEVEGVTQYRLKQLEGDVTIIEGESLLEALQATIDITDIETDTSTLAFSLEAYVPDLAEWQAIPLDDGFRWFVALFRSPLRLQYPNTARTIVFGWREVPDATQYRLTQTAGSLSILPDGQKLYTADQLIDRFALPVHLFDWDGSQFALEAFVDGEWLLIGQQDTARASPALIKPYTEADPYALSLGSQLVFGFDFALSENGATMAVGAIGETSVPLEQRECPADETECDPATSVFTARNSGAVFVYDLDANEKTRIKSPAVSEEDVFGRAVSISDDGQLLAVSAIGENSDAAGIQTAFDPALVNANAVDSGAAYVYVRNANEWVLEAYIKAPIVDATVVDESGEQESGDLFGWDVALSGDGTTLAISAVNEDGDGLSPDNNDKAESGAVFVYKRNAGIWVQEAYLKASNTDASDSFGTALAISADGNYLAVSALGESGNAFDPASNVNVRSGAVYIFARDALTGEWTETSYLKASNANAGDAFGQSISFDAGANILVVGAPFEDHLAAGVTAVDSGTNLGDGSVGAAYLFERSGSGVSSSWEQKSFYFKASNPNPAAAFGQAVVLSSGGDYLAVSAWGDSSESVGVNGGQNGNRAPGSGAAYIFQRQGGDDSWRQIAFVKAPVQAPYLYFGSVMDMALNGALLGVAGTSLGSRGLITGSPGVVYLY